MKIILKGYTVWQGPHSIAIGAQKIDFLTNDAYEITLLIEGFANAMDQVAGNGFNNWEVHAAQSILGKAFPPFGLLEGQIYGEFDLLYILNDMMFWGAKHVNGRSFDKVENRPDNLHIPMVRVG